jgi:hypothetical protein
MTDTLPPFLIKFNEIVEESRVFLFITRDSDLQRAACTKLQDMLAEVVTEKKSAIAAGNENYANALLGCECMASALIAEIKMWLLLKEGRPDKAWDELVAAQYSILGALRAHEGFAHTGEYTQRLDAIEHLVFPPQVFLSSGLVVKSQICSICGKEYEDCQHVKGRPYMGRFCNVRLILSEVDHIAIVDAPADKRCRIVQFSAAGGNRNRMTWRVEPSDADPKEGTQDLTTQGIIATSTLFSE